MSEHRCVGEVRLQARATICTYFDVLYAHVPRARAVVSPEAIGALIQEACIGRVELAQDPILEERGESGEIFKLIYICNWNMLLKLLEHAWQRILRHRIPHVPIPCRGVVVSVIPPLGARDMDGEILEILQHIFPVTR